MTFKFTGYNQAYRDETARKADSRLGRQIYLSRWEFIQRHRSTGTLLDYGCGTGAFHALAPDKYEATGWDVNPTSEFNKPVKKDRFDILTMWDVIEHLDSPFDPIRLFKPEYVFVSSPNADNAEDCLFENWRHFKPVEHLFYFTPKTLSMSLRSIGYQLLEVNFSEGKLRDYINPKAIFSAAYKCLSN